MLNRCAGRLLILFSIVIACSSGDPSDPGSVGGGAAGAAAGAPLGDGGDAGALSSSGMGGVSPESGASGVAGEAGDRGGAGTGDGAAGAAGAASGGANSGGADAGGADAGEEGGSAGSGGMTNAPRVCGSPSVAELNAGKPFDPGTGYFEGGTKLLDFGASRGPLVRSGDRVVARRYPYTPATDRPCSDTDSPAACTGWILWDSVSGNQLGSGSSGEPLGAAGSIFVVYLSRSASEIRSLAGGQLLGTVNGRVWGVAIDGSYVWGKDQDDSLAVWELSGTLKHTYPGEAGDVFAAPDELRILPVSEHYVHYLNVTTGAQTSSSAAFIGDGTRWFADGGHFLTVALSQVVRIYTPDVVLSGTLNLPGYGPIGGYGGYVWATGGQPASANIYSIGADTNAPTPVVTFPYSGSSWFASGETVAFSHSPPGQPVTYELKVVHLGSLSTETFPLPWVASAFAADLSGRWSVTWDRGVIYNQGTVSDSSASAFLGCGWSIDSAGSKSGLVAAITGAGIVLMDTTSQLAGQVIPSTGHNHLALSDAGSLLLAGSDPGYRPYLRWGYIPATPGLDVFSLPSKTPYNWPSTQDFRLSRDGTRLAQGCSNKVTDPTGGNVITLVPQSDCSTPRLSPSGASIAVPNLDVMREIATGRISISVQPQTSIYQGATLMNIVVGFGVGWIDDNRLLVQSYQHVGNAGNVTWKYLSSFIYDSQGMLVTTLASLPALGDFDTISSTQIMSTISGTVYDLTSGMAVSTGASEQLLGPRVFAHAGASIVRADDGIYITPD